jgi:hypothetical protein
MYKNQTEEPAPAETRHDEHCASCDIPAFCRSNFYTGKLLTERDLTAEQRYFVDKFRLHYVALHGWGVVCGLMVRPHPECPDRFVITPGLAIDDCGREIRVLTEYVVQLPKPKTPPPEPYHDHEKYEGYQKRQEYEEHEKRGEYEKRDRYEEPERRDSYEKREEREPNQRYPDHERRTWYVCIKFNECQQEYMPVLYDECCGTTKQPNRVCESFTITLEEEPPKCLEHEQRHRHCGENDCDELYHTIPENCPAPGTGACIPLAIIRAWHHCEPVTEKVIDNRIRPIVPTGRLLQQLIHCALEKLPKTGRALTHIRYFNWDHDGDYRPHDFFRLFVGAHEARMGFEIEFDRRVHPAGLTSRTFQAVIVRDIGEHRSVHIAPARVHRSDDGYRCSLQIDPDFAREHCHEQNFDLFITLKCDKVVDEHGLAVDGNLFARLIRDEGHDYVVQAPTGDGTPGGLFESWIRVRRGEARQGDQERRLR